jgi:hypothetical protein
VGLVNNLFPEKLVKVINGKTYDRNTMEQDPSAHFEGNDEDGSARRQQGYQG